jgi:hypothetical protein
MKNFSLQKLTELYHATTINDKEYAECKKYVLECIYPLKSGQYYIFENDKLEMIEEDAFTKQYKNRFPKEIKNWFISSPDIVYYNLVCEPNKDYIIDTVNKQINGALKIKAKYKKFETFSAKTKNQVKTMLNHLLEVNCNRKQDQYLYLLKIIKRMCLGIKNNVIVVLCGLAEGTGKSTAMNFISEHLLGSACVCVGTPAMVERFNFPMFGKYMITFDEAERIFKSNTASAVATFKTWATESRISYEDKNKSSFTATNHHTMVMTANDTSFNPNGHGRRYFLVDINPERKGDEKYFIKLYECFNDDCGDAFYSYLIDNVQVEENFVPDLKMPMTESKKQEIAERLPKPFIFLKDNYVLKNLDVDMRLNKLYNEYELCGKYHKMGVRKFSDYIRQSPLKDYLTSPINGYVHLRIKHKDLNAIYEKNNWLTEFDENVSDEIDDDRIDNDAPDYKAMYEALLKENVELKKKVEVEEQTEDELEAELLGIETPKRGNKGITIIEEPDVEVVKQNIKSEDAVSSEDVGMLLSFFKPKQNKMVLEL